ncbi:MAG TPA: 5-oxoprolinase subunit PxpB [Thermaerobacter sp.]
MTAGGLPAGVRLRPAGDAGVYVELSPGGEPAPARVLALWRELNRRPLPGMVSAVPGYTSVLVTWDPDRADPEAVQAELARRLARLPSRPRLPAGRLVVLPVVYGGPFGPDLEAVARHCGLSPEEVVRLHSRATYRVWLVGFLPGYVYLGPLDRRLWTPRRATPRVRVPAGSVGIGGSQTGIYSVESPGGWHLLGRTWIRLWDPERPEPALLRPGDRVRLQPVAARQAPAAWLEQAGLADGEAGGLREAAGA